MNMYIEKGTARGEIIAPASKSMAHRLLICAAICEGESCIDRLPSCQDVLATIDCLRAMGVKINYDGERAIVRGIDFANAKPNGALYCRESGSTLRFLIPLALLSSEKICLAGSEKLISRPQGIFEEICHNEGFLFNKESDKITLQGKLSAGEYRLRGDVSSQFITGLLFALSTLKDDSKIIITTKLESRSYVDLTISAMSEFGVKISWENDYTLMIKGGQKYTPTRLAVEGDWSGGSFIDAFNHLGGSVEIQGLNQGSLQGDRVYREYFNALDLGFTEINIEDCPDLAPILFTLAAIKNGGKFIGTRRLKIKESDRAEAMKSELSKFGADIIVEENTVTVNKTELHTPTEKLFGHNDHRIVMSLAVISSIFGGEIEGCEAVSKSYPDFFKDISTLGIHAYETH